MIGRLSVRRPQLRGQQRLAQRLPAPVEPELEHRQEVPQTDAGDAHGPEGEGVSVPVEDYGQPACRLDGLEHLKVGDAVSYHRHLAQVSAQRVTEAFERPHLPSSSHDLDVA